MMMWKILGQKAEKVAGGWKNVITVLSIRKVYNF
jgi:hypothetical protein